MCFSGKPENADNIHFECLTYYCADTVQSRYSVHGSILVLDLKKKTGS